MKNDEIISKIETLMQAINKLKPLSKELEAKIFQKFRLDWNYHSNAIEGNSLNLGETHAFIMEGLTAKGKPLKDHLDIKGHDEAIDFIGEMIFNEQYFTEKEIRELHKLILVEPYISKAQTQEGIPTQKIIKLGEYKSSPNHVKTQSGAIHYYALPQETPARMNDLMNWLKENAENYHPLVLSAIFHHKFVEIHPFDDGNGRMARLLMNFILMKNHFPPVVIKMEDRNAYYFALSNAASGNTNEFIAFIGKNLIYSLEIYLKGARGESIEELGDFEKELLLYKKKLEVKNKLEFSWSEELQKEEVELFLNNFFIKLRNKIAKLTDLFFKFDYFLVVKSKTIHSKLSSEFQKMRYYSTDYDSNSFYLVRTDANNLIQYIDDFQNFNIKNNIAIFQFRGFKFNKIPFDFEIQFHVFFGEYFVEIFMKSSPEVNFDIENQCFNDVNLTNISENKNFDKLLLKKKYREVLDESEVSEIIENTGKLILENIKKEELTRNRQ